MTAPEAFRLRRLAAELRAEVERVDRTAEEAREAVEQLDAPEPGRLVLYGAAALMETFYTGIEKALLRVAAAMGDVPDGPSWHRVLLESAALDIPEARPPVLSRATVESLDEYLAFRHRFRNLYLFDLNGRAVSRLLRRIETVWGTARQELLDFAATAEQLARQLEE